MPLTIVRQDITKMKVDAIVNAANTDLAQGGGVCGAIFSAAGAREVQTACDKLAPIKTGEAVITPGFALPAKYVIHAAGPVYRDGKHGEEQLLRDAYTNSLRLATDNKCESVAFPLISSGIYGYPKAEALAVATAAIRDFIADHDIGVSLVVFDKAAFTVSEKLLGEVESYIDEHYVEEHRITRRELLNVEREALASMFAPSIGGTPQGLDDIVENLDEPFSATLLRLIDKSGKSDADIYKRANIDRRLFSKIRSNAHYAPSKPTVLAFAVALRLTLGQTEDLLERAGFALSHSRKFDVIVEYFIVSGKYDIFEINNVLFEYDQTILGGTL
ncbi:MAG: macro domain-containing protein [Clostridiaceae bacterium]|jgi:O-acetyl-ADP-ribose deacetylase (regulator of RNase III)|nr:macro domain-containing protein [Clostridiaceae bacterium]